MRFNPPGSWPTPPLGWLPPAGWNPDPAWPPAPRGWTFWLTADGYPAPLTFAPDVQPWDPRTVATSVQPSLYAMAPPMAPQPMTPPMAGSWNGPRPTFATHVAEVRAARRSALRPFGMGVGAFALVAAAVWVTGQFAYGRVVWIGGLVIGVSLMIRSAMVYSEARSDAVPVQPRSVVAVVAGLAIALFSGISAVSAWADRIHDAEVATGLGSCWVRDGANRVAPVDCDQSHDFTITAVVEAEEACPTNAVMYVDVLGKAGCLVPD